MEVKNRITYDIDKSSERIDEILAATNSNFADAKNIPSRASITYTNGFYVNVSALFIDIVGSSEMTDGSKRPTLAKIYRSFISEMTAILNSCDTCEEISINGDCVWGVFNTPYQKDINDVFSVAAMMNSLTKILNYKYRKKDYQQISIGIGIDYGRALMVKAGYNGSGLNDIIWMGDVVNGACHLANSAGRNNHKPLIVSNLLFSNLNEHNKSLLTKTYIDGVELYEGNVINNNMEKWYSHNCK